MYISIATNGLDLLNCLCIVYDCLTRKCACKLAWIDKCAITLQIKKPLCNLRIFESHH